MHLAPSPDRAAAIDARLRDRLAGSLDYLAGFLASDDWSRTDDLRDACSVLRAAPVAPWVFGLYAATVQDASRGQKDHARRNFDQLLAAIRAPATPRVMPLRAPADGPHWEIAHVLFNTDPQRPFLPQPPGPTEFAATTTEVAKAIDLLAEATPAIADELDVLMRTILIGVPAGPDQMQGFNGASTFFLWGASLLNAQVARGVIGTIDVLVHEASHMLLFGLLEGKALSENDPSARYASPLRTDPRPIDGIFHACFVATRVHLAMTLLRDSGTVGADLMPDLHRSMATNGRAAVTALDLLTRELRPTAAGRAVFDALSDYWQTADAEPA